jgi:hypothetical protein
MNKQQVPVARKNGIVIRKLKDEVLIYDTDQHQAHCLNPAAVLIWDHCDGERTVSELSDVLRQNNPQLTATEAEGVVWMALDQLKKSQLLELPAGTSEISLGLTRRQLIKSAGIASLVAAPIVSTIVAPMAAQASTCLASGQTCSTSAECCSGLCSASACA